MTWGIHTKLMEDNEFKALVDMMTAMIMQARFTPSEMRQAAILASIEYEHMRVRERMLVNPKIEIALREAHDLIENGA